MRAQQPGWQDSPALGAALRRLRRAPALVDAPEVARLKALIAEAAQGRRQILQVGDCAEDPANCDRSGVIPKLGLARELAEAVASELDIPVSTVGRIAGQFAKPRSRDFETGTHAGLPVFRGHLINDPRPTVFHRRHDPHRMTGAHRAAAGAMRVLRAEAAPDSPLWTSHEALVLDYETALVRRQADGAHLLTSTHWPWIGNRTNRLDSAHVWLLARVSNPVACKVGPDMEPADLVRLCRLLDPDREPGKLTLIARMGAAAVDSRLPALVRAVADAGLRVPWLCDPMHGNTFHARHNRKTRVFSTVLSETLRFITAVVSHGGTPAGLHLEATPDPVDECAWHDDQLPDYAQHTYRSLCDPRLNPTQALALTSFWADALKKELRK